MNKDSAIICFYNAHPRYHIRDTGRQKPLALQYEMTCLLHLNINTKVSCHDIFLSSDYIWLKFQCNVIRITLRSTGKVEEKKAAKYSTPSGICGVLPAGRAKFDLVYAEGPVNDAAFFEGKRMLSKSCREVERKNPTTSAAAWTEATTPARWQQHERRIMKHTEAQWITKIALSVIRTCHRRNSFGNNGELKACEF